MSKINDKELQVVEKNVNPIISKARSIEISDNEDLKKATEILSQLNRWNDQVIEDREKLTKPLNEALKEVRGRYKPIVELLEGAISEVRAKMGAYATMVDKERQKLSERVGEGKGKLKIETAMRKMEELGDLDEKVESDEGSVSFVEVKKFEVVDMKKLPDEYKVADETKIRKAMLAGIEVPGVRYFVEKSVRNTR